MRFQIYRDKSHSQHLDLVGEGDDPWTVDLVVETVSCMLVGGFVFALVAMCVR